MIIKNGSEDEVGEGSLSTHLGFGSAERSFRTCETTDRAQCNKVHSDRLLSAHEAHGSQQESKSNFILRSNLVNPRASHSEFLDHSLHRT